MANVTCSACGSTFRDRDHSVYGGFVRRMLTGPARVSVDAKLDDAALVRCPSCGSEFVSERFKYFGLFSRHRTRSLFEVYLLLILAVVLYFVYQAVRQL